MTRMRCIFPMTTKDKVADALQDVVKSVADPEGMSIGRLRVDGPGQFKGRCAALAPSHAIKIETDPPYVSQGNAIAEHGFGTIICITRSLLTAAPHLPFEV